MNTFMMITTCILLGGMVHTVEVADSPEERAQGLMNREDTKGMVFVFDNPGMKYFWMKNTTIPLDIIWINNSEVTAIEKMEPCTTCESVGHYGDTVLEFPAGKFYLREGMKFGECREKLIKNFSMSDYYGRILGI